MGKAEVMWWLHEVTLVSPTLSLGVPSSTSLYDTRQYSRSTPPSRFQTRGAMKGKRPHFLAGSALFNQSQAKLLPEWHCMVTPNCRDTGKCILCQCHLKLKDDSITKDKGENGYWATIKDLCHSSQLVFLDLLFPFHPSILYWLNGLLFIPSVCVTECLYPISLHLWFL